MQDNSKDNNLIIAIKNLTADSILFNNIAGTTEVYTKESIEQQLKIILSEVEELVTAFKSETPVSVAAEAVDVVVTVLGLLQKLNNAGIDVPEITDRIGQKNLDKFPDVSQVTLVNDTIKDYADKGITVAPSINLGKYVIRDSNGKVRKALGFTPVVLDDCTTDELRFGFPSLQ